MIELRQSTAVGVPHGPMVLASDGDTEYTTAIVQADLQLIKNGGAAAQKNDATSSTHRSKGQHTVPLDGTDTNTLGHMRLCSHVSTCLPTQSDFSIITQEEWDRKYSTGVQTDVLATAAALTQHDTDIKTLDPHGEAMRGTDTAATEAKQDTMQTAVEALSPSAAVNLKIAGQNLVVENE